MSFDPTRPILPQVKAIAGVTRDIPNPKGKEKKVRFAIGVSDAISEIWTLSSRKNDIYLSCVSMRGRIKLSVHGSGVCQLAFDAKHSDSALSTPRFPLKDRTIKRWKREDTPTVGPVYLASVFFSAYQTWDNSEPILVSKPTELLPPPPDGFAIQVPIFLSRDNPLGKCFPFNPEDIILAYFQIESGEYVTLLPAPVRLPDDYFHFRPMSWFMGVGAESDSDWDDARGISAISFMERPDGGIDFHSRHNMRIRKIPVDADLDELNLSTFSTDNLSA
jgi:hypothetical protein